MRNLVLLIINLIIVANVVEASLYGPKSKVIQLDKGNFAEKVYGTEHVWVVEFFAPWCGHCKALTPEYEKAANNLEGIIRVGAVNCDDSKNKELCGSFGIQGFPTIKIFPSKVTKVQKKKDAYHKVPEDYNGARSASSIASYALSKMTTTYVVPVSADSYDSFVSQEMPKAILFTNKPKTSDLFKALSIDFRNRIVLGEVKHTSSSLAEKYKVTKYPTLIIINKDGTSTPYPSDDKISHQLLTTFLDQFALPPPPPPSSSSSSSGTSSKKTQESTTTTPPLATGEIYEVRNQTAYDDHVKGLCFLVFLDNENMDDSTLLRYIKVMKEVGQLYKGQVRIIYMDGQTQAPLVSSLDVSSNFPAAVLINTSSQRAVKYMASFSVSSISEFLKEVLEGGRRSSYSFSSSSLPKIVTQEKQFGERTVYSSSDDVDVDVDVDSAKEKKEL